MNSNWIYVLDTHALVWFLKRDCPIGAKALKIMLSLKSKLVVPIYVFDEIRMSNATYRGDRIGLPLGATLRTVAGACNIKIFPKSPAVVLEEERIRRDVRFKKVVLPKQDIPICATAIAIQKALSETEIRILSKDVMIQRWGRVPTIWN